MAIRRVEHPNFTREQIAEAVAGACEIADGMELSAEDRAVLLPVIYGSLTSKQIVMEEIGGFPGMVVPKGNG